jgi:hypothetical protein
MKPIDDWNETDLERLISDGAEESTNLEFKGAAALENMNIAIQAEKAKSDISKDVSSFANSAGGIIIYGIEEEEQPPHKAKALSPIDPAKCSKERLEQVINSRIQPRIHGLRIHPVALDRSGPEKVSYLVNIPQSFTAHQAYDKKYYKRFNFESVPMEDYEIRQTMHRQARPTYHVRLHANPIGQDTLFVAGNVENFSVMVGHEVSAVLLVPEELSSGRGWRKELIDGITFVVVLDEQRYTPLLSPFATREIIFGGAVRIPDPIPSQSFPAIVRVYDRFGQAHEAQFCFSLMSNPRGQIVEERQESRNESP